MPQKTINRHSVKVSVFMLRYTPVLMAALLLLYIVLDTCGIDLYAIPQLLGARIVPTLILIAVCYSFRFCKMHLAFTMYCCLATYVCHDEEYNLLGCMMVRGAFIVIGAALFLWLFTHLAKFNRSTLCGEV